MIFQGKVLYLNRPNVDTDQIIPATYLDGISIGGMGVHLFEGVPSFNRENPDFKNATILVAGENFGCGSSREHAVWALEGHGFRAVIAPSFARIFRQNAFNRGLLLIELHPEAVSDLLKLGCDFCTIDVEKGTIRTPGGTCFHFKLNEFEKALVLEGGLVGFAASRYPEGVKR